MNKSIRNQAIFCLALTLSILTVFSLFQSPGKARADVATADADESDANLSAVTINAGDSPVTINITIHDSKGSPIPNFPHGSIVVTSSPSDSVTIVQPSADTDTDGHTSATITSTVAGTKTITVTAGDITLSAKPSLTVNPAAIAHITLSASATSLNVGQTSTITVSGKDQYDNPATNNNSTVVSLTASGDGSLNPTSVTLSGGTATAALTKPTAGDVQVGGTAASITANNITVNFASTINVVAPSASPAGGTYTSSQSVTLTAAGATSIRYTTDGTSPNCSTGSIYSSAISINASTNIRAISCYPENRASSVELFAYVIDVGNNNNNNNNNNNSTSTNTTGDLNNDNVVNNQDLSIFFANLGTNGSAGSFPTGDINKDGTVDFLDFVLIMVHWTK